jgi:Uma2 family endonuclease
MQPLALQQEYNEHVQPPFIDFQTIQNKQVYDSFVIEKKVPIANAYISEQEYWDNYYEFKGVSYEWCNGRLEEKPMADLASFYLYNWYLMLLNEYFRVFPECTIVGLEIGFKMVLPGQTSIRKPDLAIIHKSNPVQMQLDDRSYKGCFDLCIELISDSTQSEIYRDTVIKKAEYEQAGIKEYFILDRNHTETVFYRLNHNNQYAEILPDKNGIIKSEVLSNFQFRYDDLFRLPSCEQLREDAVYSHYFQTDYLQLRQRMEKAKRQADDAIRRADDEKRRADDEKRRADDAIRREKALLSELAVLKQS